jgi:ubiquinone/menaquinone biosynthesis C-methylase UbiE
VSREPIDEVSPREGYDRWAASYDEYDNPLIALEEPVVRGLLGDPSGLRAADIGCGTGRHAKWLLEGGARVTGVDFSTGMLGKLRQTHPPEALEIIEHDLTLGVPLPSDSFDLVTCCLVIEHLPDLEGALSELGRICRPGGRIVISDFHPEMVRRGYHARFHESEGGRKWQIRGASHTIGDYVMAAVRSGLRIEHLSEHVMTGWDDVGLMPARDDKTVE